MEAQARIRENWMTLGDETAISQSSLTRDLSLQASSLEAGLLLCVLRQNPMFSVALSNKNYRSVQIFIVHG